MNGIDKSLFLNKARRAQNLAKLLKTISANLFNKVKSGVASLFTAPAFALA